MSVHKYPENRKPHFVSRACASRRKAIGAVCDLSRPCCRVTEVHMAKRDSSTDWSGNQDASTGARAPRWLAWPPEPGQHRVRDGRAAVRTIWPSVRTKSSCIRPRKPSSNRAASSRAPECHARGARAAAREDAQLLLVEPAEGDEATQLRTTDDPGTGRTRIFVRLCSLVRSTRGAPECPGSQPRTRASGRAWT